MALRKVVQQVNVVEEIRGTGTRHYGGWQLGERGRPGTGKK